MVINMTRTLLLEAFRNIGKQLASFISIIIISMLAVLVYLGISFSASAMDQNVSDYYHDRNTQDLQVISPLLLTEGDLESIRALDGVADAEASLETIAWLPIDDGKLEVSVLSMPQRISLPRILAGSAPTSSGECMIENGLAEKLNLKVGDHVNLGGRAEDLPSLLKETSFTISGVFTHPDHITDKISFSPYILVDEEAFDQTLMKGNWSRIRVTLAEMPGNYFLNDYRNAVKPVEDALHELSKDRIPLRYEEVRETYEKQISDGEAELMEAKSKLDDAAKHLAEGEAELENVETQIADGERQLQDGEQKIHEAEVQIADAEKQIHDAEENAADSLEQLEEGRARLAEAESILGLAPGQIDAAEKMLNNTRELLDRLRDYLNRHRDASYYTSILTLYEYLENAWEEGRTDYYYSGEQYLDGLTAYEQGKKAIEEAETQLRELLDAREQLENKKGELAERKSELEQKRRELDEGKKQVAESRLDLEEKRREYDQGLRGYDEYLRELDDARGQLAQLETGAWIVRNNQADAGFVYCAVNSSNLSSFSSTF